MKANSRQFCFLKSMMLMSGAFGVLQIGSLELVRAEDTAYRAVDASRINDSDVEAGNWLSYGRTYSETRYSLLTLINDKNATSLGLAWFADLDTNRGQEATPIVVDGVLYVSTAWSMVKAYDAGSGQLLWSYDPKVRRELGVNGCFDVGNRGVAAWKGKLGYTWGHGTLYYSKDQKEYKFKLSGISVVDVGGAAITAEGEVYNLATPVGVLENIGVI
jgi:glucose dehydrogenase